MAVTRMMREQFQKNEKIALRSSKVYKDVYKMKQIQVELAAQRIRKGGGEAYIDSDRRIAVAQGKAIQILLLSDSIPIGPKNTLISSFSQALKT